MVDPVEDQNISWLKALLNEIYGNLLGEFCFPDFIGHPYPQGIYSLFSHGHRGILTPVQTNQPVGGFEDFARGTVVSEEVELAGLGIDVSDPIDFIRKGALEGKDGLVVIEKEGDVGLLRGKVFDQPYLNRIEILRLVNQDVSRRSCCILLCLELFESKKKEVVVVKSQPLESLILPEKLSYLFPFLNQAELSLADNSGDLSMVAVDARRLRRQSYDDSVIIFGKDSDRLSKVCLKNPVAKGVDRGYLNSARVLVSPDPRAHLVGGFSRMGHA